MEEYPEIVFPQRSPVESLEPSALRLLERAQAEAQRRGYHALLSGLVLLEAMNADEETRDRVLLALETGEAKVKEPVDAEWSTRTALSQDQPKGLLREAIIAAVQAQEPPKLASIESLIVAVLAFDDSMASRVIRRLERDPMKVVANLRS